MSENYLPFEVARRVVQGHRLKTKKDWDKWCAGSFKGMKKPPEIPQNPETVYAADGWVSWSNFMGANRYKAEKRRGAEKRTEGGT